MIGETISHYRVVERLGAGGMGEVYRAEDTKLGRTVALKFLSPRALGTEEEKRRFEHEARAAAALNHPNICTVYEIDEAEGRSFIAMELVEGQSLKEVIGDGPLKLDRAVGIALQAAQGLEEAHGKGIVHRDIKSANIMLTSRDQVKITDFGLAKSPGRTQLTKEGSTLGTIAYMSPEQARGEGVDYRTDIWSLGVVLYEMVSGRLPFSGDYDQAVVYSILHESPEPLTGLRTGVPVGLERVAARCLEKDPAERYQTAADLASDLRRLARVLSEGPTAARPADAGRAAGRKSRWWPWAAAFLAIAILVTVVVTRERPLSEETAAPRPVSERKILVVLPFQNLGPPEDEYFADGVTEEITSRLAALRGLGVISRTSALQYKGTTKTVWQIGKELNVDYLLEGTVRWDKGAEGSNLVRVTPQLIRVSDDTHIWTDRYDEQFSGIFTVQTMIAERVAEALDITLSDREQSALRAKPTDNIVAYQAYLRGIDYMKYPHAPKENYLRAEQMLEQAVGLDPRFTLAYVRLAEAHRSLYFFGHDRTAGRLAKAKEAIDRAIELNPELPEVHDELGYYYYHALLDYDRALEEFSIAAKGMPSETDLLQEIAYIWRRQGLFEQAIANLEQAVAIDPKNMEAMVELAHTYTFTRQYDKAIRYCDRAIAVAPDNQWSHLIKSYSYLLWTGDLEKVRAALERIPVRTTPSVVQFAFWLEIYEGNYTAALDRLSVLSGDALEMQSQYAPKDLLAGLAYRSLDEPARARAAFESALMVAERAARERPDDPRVQSALGLIYAELERKDEAIRAGERAVELYPVSKDALLGTARIWDLALIYARVGEYDAALEQLEYLLSIQSPYSIVYYNLSPTLESLRRLPGYKRLVRLYGEETLK